MKTKLTIKDFISTAIAVYLGSCYVKGNLNVFEFSIAERLAQLICFGIIIYAIAFVKIMEDD